MHIDTVQQVGLTETQLQHVASNLCALCKEFGAAHGRLWLTTPQGAGPLAEHGTPGGTESAAKKSLGDIEVEAALSFFGSPPEGLQPQLEQLVTRACLQLVDARLLAFSNVNRALSKRLHDKVCQDLTAAKLELELLQLQGQAPPAVEKVIGFLHAASVEVRDILGDLKSG
ncbi:MAG: hypothetical protein KC910_31660 [Candidatus Eremiobacteraeota bacterium]|nr:hypothetical protein [Candidatus Eremiobacteraeota bacterium]